jgi:hypothetical protein
MRPPGLVTLTICPSVWWTSSGAAMWCITATLNTTSKVPSGKGKDVPDPVTACTSGARARSCSNIPSDGSIPVTS